MSLLVNQERHPVIRFSKTLLCLTAILTNSNHQHNGMEGTKNSVSMPCVLSHLGMPFVVLLYINQNKYYITNKNTKFSLCLLKLCSFFYFFNIYTFSSTVCSQTFSSSVSNSNQSHLRLNSE